MTDLATQVAEANRGGPALLLYECETWKMNKGDNKTIDVFQNTYLRRILRVKWEGHVITEELRESADMKPLSKEIKRRRWKMIGCIQRHTTELDTRMC